MTGDNIQIYSAKYWQKMRDYKTFIQSGLGNKNPRQRFTLSVHSFKNYGPLNGEHSPKFTQHVSLEYQRWLAERFILAWTL
jgi:hypothetical protein